MLAIPLKQPDGKAVDWGGALHKYVKNTYSKRHAEMHRQQFAGVADLREQIGGVQQLTDTTAEGVRNLLLQYDWVMTAMERRFEMKQLRLTFGWKDAFKPYVKQSEADTRYEKTVILFNLASVSSFLAICQKRSDAEGIRVACQNFQQAAWLLDTVKEMVSSAPWGSQVSVDITPRTLEMLYTLMLAQAQRCFYEKAVRDALSEKLLSNIAAQVAAYYDEVLGLMGVPPIKQHLDDTWAEVVKWNLKMFEGLAQYHAAAEHAAEYHYGKQVARLNLAVERTREAVKLSSKSPAQLRVVYEEALQKVSREQQQAVKDNSSVYMEPVPAAATLPPVACRSIVKPMAVPELQELSPSQPDPFVHLVPSAVQHELEGYVTQAGKRVDGVHVLLEEAFAAGQQRLLDLDLPHALQAALADGNDGELAEGSLADLPSDLKEALQGVSGGTGEKSLREALGQLDELSGSCAGKVGEVKAVLLEMEEIDAEGKEAHGDRWALATSTVEANKEVKDDLALCERKLEEGRGANDTVRARFEEKATQLGLLALSIDELRAQVPTHGSARSVATHEATQKLRDLLATVDEHKRARDTLIRSCLDMQCATRVVEIEREKGLKIGVTLTDVSSGQMGVEVDAVGPGSIAASAGICVGDRIVSVDGQLCRNKTQAVKLLEDAGRSMEVVIQSAPYEQELVTKLVYRGDSSAEPIIAEALAKFLPLEEQAAQFVQQHQQLLDEVAAANEAFTVACISLNEASLSEKQNYFKQLNQAVTVCTELSSQAAEGVDFFSGALERLEGLLSKARELAAAMRLEREELDGQVAAARSSLQRQATVAVPLPLPPSFDAAASTSELPSDVEVPEAEVKQLMDMGFSRGQAVGALEASNGQVDQALGLLLGSSSPRAAEAPQLPAVPVRQQSSRKPFEAPVALPPKVQQLVEMGFSKEQAAAALQQNDGCVQEAAAALLAAPAPPPTAAAAAPPAAAPAPAPSASAELQELVGMGFNEELAADVLRRCNGRFEDAVVMLLDSNAAAPPAATPTPVASTHPAGAAAGTSCSASGRTSQELQSLVEMGFGVQQAEQALNRASGNRDAALSSLLEDETSQQHLPVATARDATSTSGVTTQPPRAVATAVPAPSPQSSMGDPPPAVATAVPQAISPQTSMGAPPPFGQAVGTLGPYNPSQPPLAQPPGHVPPQLNPAPGAAPYLPPAAAGFPHAPHGYPAGYQQPGPGPTYQTPQYQQPSCQPPTYHHPPYQPQPPYQQPPYQQPPYQQPPYQQPPYQQPPYQQPHYQQAPYQQPPYQQPSYPPGYQQAYAPGSAPSYQPTYAGSHPPYI